VKNKNGEKEVYINCMCELVSLDFADWKKELIDIADVDCTQKFRQIYN
jgi:hypothetical protein